jgi:uncharacterized repeat protein (TIGR01451 family)
MATHTMRRRISALGTVLGLGVALPFAVGVTPAYAAAEMNITKTHSGDFARGGQGVYRITVTNFGDEASGEVDMVDTLPAGLTFTDLGFVSTSPVDLAVACFFGAQITCNAPSIPAGGGFTVDMTVSVAADAPCTLTNTATVTDSLSGTSDSASDPTTVTGGECDDDNGGGGLIGSILPVNLNGVLPMFNNITTNSNINSPGASNSSRQNLLLNAP